MLGDHGQVNAKIGARPTSSNDLEACKHDRRGPQHPHTLQRVFHVQVILITPGPTLTIYIRTLSSHFHWKVSTLCSHTCHYKAFVYCHIVTLVLIPDLLSWFWLSPCLVMFLLADLYLHLHQYLSLWQNTLPSSRCTRLSRVVPGISGSKEQQQQINMLNKQVKQLQAHASAILGRLGATSPPGSSFINPSWELHWQHGWFQRFHAWMVKKRFWTTPEYPRSSIDSPTRC